MSREHFKDVTVKVYGNEYYAGPKEVFIICDPKLTKHVRKVLNILNINDNITKEKSNEETGSEEVYSC